MKVTAAVVQMRSTADVAANLGTATRLVEEAAARGARFVSLPENFAFLRSEGEPVPEPQAIDGEWVSHMAGLAAKHRLLLLLGSLPEKAPG
jgi:predicted amidohydrolase